MRGRLVSGGNAAPFRLAYRVEKAVTDLARYSRPAFARSAHRVEMEWASLEAFAPPRYYITRSGMPARPWRLERVSLGKAESLAAFRTHAEAVAAADKWVSDDAGRDPNARPSDVLAFAVDVPPSRDVANICMASLLPNGDVMLELVDRDAGTSWVPALLREMQDRPVPGA